MSSPLPSTKNQYPAAPIMVINIPPKIWRPKAKNKYTPPMQIDDIDEGLFLFEKFGKCIFKPSTKWQDNLRTDLIEFNPETHKKELEDNFKIGTNATSETKAIILNLIKEYWDCFCGDGARRPIIGYEFSIDTGQSSPICKYLLQFV